jgi:hypothetical protein
VTRAKSESGEEGPIPFIHMTGRMGNALAPKPPRLEADVGYYGFGREAFDAFPFPPLVGTIQLRDNGIDFLVSDTISIGVAWRGSKEIGDGPDPGKLARLRLLGLAEVAWRQMEGVEERLQRGEFLTGVPAETEVLEVAFDPGNREQVMALAPESDGALPTLRFKGMIVGKSGGSGEGDDMPRLRGRR